MGVEVDRQADFLLERLDQRVGGRGLQEPGHVLDAEDVGACGAQLLRHGHVVLEVVLRPRRIGKVAGVADRRLAELARLDDRVERDAHVLDPVQRVEHPEHVDAGPRRLRHEGPHHVVGIVGVADAVRGAQQHLGHQVRHRRPQVAQPLPRAFLQEAVGDVEGRAAPAFDAEELRQHVRVGRRHPDHVVGPHPRREQALVPVAHRRVGDEQPPLGQHPVGDRLRALRLEELPGARRRRVERHHRRPRRPRLGRRPRPSRGLRVPVDGDVGDVGQDLRRPVAARREMVQLGGRVDELGRVGIVEERRVLEQVLDEGDVGRDPADAELAERPVEPRDRHLRRRRPGGHLLQERVVVAGDHRPRIGGAAVEPDAVPGGAAVGGDPAVVGDEVVLRVLGGDPALDRVAVEGDLGLRGLAGRLGERRALGDHDLRPDDVDAGDLLGHRMLDLDARVDLDEVEGAGVAVHQELDGAGALVVRRPCDRQPERAELLALALREIRRRRPLDDLLVAPLHRAVALPEMVDRPVLVAEDLHLDVPGVQDHLLEVALAVAEGVQRLAPAFEHLVLELLRPHDRPHSPAAAAPARLQHERIADRLGHPADLVHVVGQHLGRRDHRHPGGHRHLPRARLIAEHPHGPGLRADEGDPRRGAGVDEVGVLATGARSQDGSRRRRTSARRG